MNALRVAKSPVRRVGFPFVRTPNSTPSSHEDGRSALAFLTLAPAPADTLASGPDQGTTLESCFEIVPAAVAP